VKRWNQTLIDQWLVIFYWSIELVYVRLHCLHCWQGQITIGTLILLVGLIQLIKPATWQINWIFWEVKERNWCARLF
jgi:hypothetical protein